MPRMIVEIEIDDLDADSSDATGVTEEVYLNVAKFAGQYGGLLDVSVEDD